MKIYVLNDLSYESQCGESVTHKYYSSKELVLKAFEIAISYNKNDWKIEHDFEGYPTATRSCGDWYYEYSISEIEVLDKV